MRGGARVAAGLAEWDAAARAMVDLAASRGSASEEVFAAFEHEAETSRAWDVAVSAATRAMSEGGSPGPRRATSRLALAVWHRDRGAADPGRRRGERCALALEHDASSVPLLTALARPAATTPRPAPSSTRFSELSKATGDAATSRSCAKRRRLLVTPVGDPDLARSILEDALELARSRWSRRRPPTSATATQTRERRRTPRGVRRVISPSRPSLACTKRRETPKALADVLVSGADLPFSYRFAPLDAKPRGPRRGGSPLRPRLPRHRSLSLALRRRSARRRGDRATGVELRLARAHRRLAPAARTSDRRRRAPRRTARAETADGRSCARSWETGAAEGGRSAGELGRGRASRGVRRGAGGHARGRTAIAGARRASLPRSADYRAGRRCFDAPRGLRFRAAEVAEAGFSDPAAAESHHTHAW